jgi:hypothetical protein
MTGAPYFYDYQNAIISQTTPNTVHVKNVGLTRFFQRYLLQKAISVFKWKMPSMWSRDYFLYTLYCWGFIAIVNTDKFGVIPQGCGLKGYNVFYQPRSVIIQNPLINQTLEPEIGRNCVLLKLQPDFCGIMDLVSFYAQEMALASEAVDVNLLNSKLSYVFTASNKNAAESLKKLYDRIASGEPAVVVDKALYNDDGTVCWEAFQQNVGQNYIVSDLLSDLRKIEAEFDTKVGIPNANTDKKERLISDEVTANNVETRNLPELWLESLRQGCEEARKMFGIDLSVDWRNQPEQSMQPTGGGV